MTKANSPRTSRPLLTGIAARALSTTLLFGAAGWACDEKTPMRMPPPETGSGGSGGRPAGSGGAPGTGGAGGVAVPPGNGGSPATGGTPGATGGAPGDGGGVVADAPMPNPGDAAPDSPAPSGAAFRIFFIDAEGGAATLLISPTGESLLADAGWGGARDAGRIAAVLEQETGKKELSYFLATHYHVDHVSGAPTLARSIKIDKFIDHGASVEGGGDFNTYRSAVMIAMADAKRITAQPGLKFMLGGVEITIVTAAGRVANLPTAIANPGCAGATMRNDAQDEDPQSVGFVARYGKFEFVDLGDLTAGVEHRLVCPMNQVGLVDLFQASQHGSAESSPPQLVAGFAPQVVVFNNGAGKGGDGSIFARFKTAATTKDVWSLHRKSGNSADQNADEPLIANADGPDMGHWIRASVQADGSFTLTNRRTMMSRSYTAR